MTSKRLEDICDSCRIGYFLISGFALADIIAFMAGMPATGWLLLFWWFASLAMVMAYGIASIKRETEELLERINKLDELDKIVEKGKS